MGLTWPYRLYFYGIHGFCNEVVFTCLYDIPFKGFNPALTGYSSCYAFLLYGLSCLSVEYFYQRYLGNIHILSRALAYIVYAFTWELSTGLLLSMFDACPWDYSDHRFNFLGLITLEYTPVWCAFGFYVEFVSNILAQMTINNGNTKDS